MTAEHVHPRITLDGSEMPPLLPATASVFAGGEAGSRHVEVIASVLDTGAARRLDPGTWAGAEAQLAERATRYTPSELRTWDTALIDALDQDGPEPVRRRGARWIDPERRPRRKALPHLAEEQIPAPRRREADGAMLPGGLPASADALSLDDV